MKHSDRNSRSIGQFMRMAAIARAGAEMRALLNDGLLFTPGRDYAKEFKDKQDVLGLLSREANRMSYDSLAVMFKDLRRCVEGMMRGISCEVKVKVINTFLQELSVNLVRAAATTAASPKTFVFMEIKPN